MKKGITILVFCCITFFINAQVTGVFLINEMVEKCKAVKTLRYTQIKKEMTDGVIRNQVMNAKMQVSPFKIYFFQKSPKEGLEGLFVTGKNNNELLINPNRFPWINISLDPYGNTVRKNNHHVVFQSGFQYMADILNRFIVQYGNNAEKNFIVNGSENYKSFDCWKMTINAPNFHYYEHTVKSGETVTSIANKVLVNDYMILRENNLSGYNDISIGDIIKVPSAYGKKIDIWFDKKIKLLRKVVIYDERGFYESFEYPIIKINPTIEPEEFTEDYDSYGF